MTLTISVISVSFGMKGDDVARIHQALRAIGRNIPPDEASSATMGPGTVAVVRALQQDLGAPVTGIVDAATVRAINARLSAVATDQRVVRGRVFDADGNPAKGMTVSAFLHLPTGEAAVGAPTDPPVITSDDGSYSIRYIPPTGGRADIRLQVSSVIAGPAGSTSVVMETTPSSVSILIDAGPVEGVDFTLSGPNNPPKSEYERVVKGIAPFQGGRALASLTGLDVSLISLQSGYTPDQIAALAAASQQGDGNVPPEVIYGLIRAGLPSHPAALRSAHADIRLKALQAAVNRGIVPAKVNGNKITSYLAGLAAVSGAPLKALLHGVFNDGELGKFMTIYSQNTQDPAAFWRAVSADATLGPRAEKARLLVQISSLVNDYQPLINLAAALPGITKASDLVRVTEEQWKGLIATQGVGVPPETPGANADEKAANYAATIVEKIEAAAPTAFFAEKLPASNVKTFLQTQTAYQFSTSYFSEFVKSNPAAAQGLNAQDRRQLLAYQRIHRLTAKAEETLALATLTLPASVGSSQQIVRMDRKVFAARFKGVLSAERADAIYDQALRTHATALALYSKYGTALNRTSMRVLPKLDSARQAQSAALSIPDWQTLFGSSDYCACRECASVHGPAAYFVDIVNFLSKSVRDVLFARRPDLGDIELSCENTNTPVPLIDLVTEVLENAVAPPPAFAAFILPPALGSDLAQTTVTAALSAAFHPALSPGARVEVLEAGKRWRIWDTSFTYSVVTETGGLKVSTRTRQTFKLADGQPVMPQYFSEAAYAELANSVFPWNLPFDLPWEEGKAFLTHLGAPRHQIMEALRPEPDPFVATSPEEVSLAAERLGLTDIEWKIIVDQSPHEPKDFWGSATVAVMTKVQELLDTSGVSYRELDSLLATWFVNPDGTVSIAAVPHEPADSCNTGKLQINGLDDGVLGRIHRFVRLWRTLGWTIAEVDAVVHALAADPNAPVLTDEMLVRVDHLRLLAIRLRLPVADTLTLWTPIPTAGVDSRYRALFYNAAVFQPPDDAFHLTADGTEVLQPGNQLMDHASVVQAAFRLSADGLALLAANTDGKLNLANLSMLYRHAILARQLGMAVPELLTVLDLTGLNPFQTGRSQDALRLVDVVDEIQRSGFDLPQLDYLVRGKSASSSPFVPLDSDLAATLGDLRDALLKIRAPLGADRQMLERSLVIDHISLALNLPGDLTATLLDSVKHLHAPVLGPLMGLSALAPGTVLTRANAGPQFAILQRLLDIASIVQTLELPGTLGSWLLSENEWLASVSDSQAPPVTFASWYSLIQFQQFRRALSLENGAIEAILVALRAVSTATPEPAAAKTSLIENLSKWIGWAEDDLRTLLGEPDHAADSGLLRVQAPGDYRVNLLIRLNRAMTLLKRTGVSAEKANQWSAATVTSANAREIRAAAKAKHNDPAWGEIVVPIQNTLRDKQREALAGYLIARPALWSRNPVLAKATVNDLFDYFLIDVKMTSCQMTSRIKQAIGSVQLFAQRYLMGLERSIPTDDTRWARWDWMKNFRVWEANRKIWLYPENWIEPELRDNKSPFFIDLEDELAQSDLDNDAAEIAFSNYLEKLDTVSRLEIAAVYQDDTSGVLHVVGRTFHTPHVHYHRTRKGDARIWTAWEKLDLDIEGDHLILAMCNSDLVITWPIFTEKQVRLPVTLPQPGGTLESGARYWEIQLAWSEYKNSRWTSKNLSAPAALISYQRDMIGFEPVDATGQISNTVGVTGLISKELISFKPLMAGDRLSVRGFLRRDYQANPENNDTRIACPFGEFRFTGCQKIVTIVGISQLDGINFPLAPAGTKFDGMWFTGSGPGLVLFDGAFPVTNTWLGGTIIAGDPSTTVNNQQDIPVLDHSSSFRLSVSHQESQFVADVPFFYEDSSGTFLVSSTGRSGTRVDAGGWLDGNVAMTWRADYFPSQSVPPAGELQETGTPALAVLLPGPGGQRIATSLAPVNLNPGYSRASAVSTFWTTRRYTFASFHHPYLCKFTTALDRKGISELLSLPTQSLSDSASFDPYLPTARVTRPLPTDAVEFEAGSAYELYNWELFFHIPFLVATRLSQNQRFEEAQKWFHYIFNPGALPDPHGEQTPSAPQARYWVTKPFHDRLSGDYEADSVRNLEILAANGSTPELEALKIAIDQWRDNPFNPHAIARFRLTAYQMAVVMKYLDNLIAWGDQLFLRDTLESINEATLIYVLAAEILGPRPEAIDRGTHPVVQTFNSLLPRLGLLGNALEQIELLAPATEGAPLRQNPQTPDPPSDGILYFCVPENDGLLSYWSTVADRLFKIRNCMNFQGQVRQLPLFEPPIDPALLVRARAAGLSIADVLSDLTAPSLPNYRFSVMYQKANEFVAEVRSMGAELLSVLEKRDAEALAALHSGQELRLSQAVRDVRAKQVDDATSSIASLQQSRAGAQARKEYYEGREFENAQEAASRGLTTNTVAKMTDSRSLRKVASWLGRAGAVKIGSPATAGVEVGLDYLARAMEAEASSIDSSTGILSVQSQLAARMGEFVRRRDEWKHQASLAAIELKQLDEQLLASQIRLDIAATELRNHDQQIENARDVDQFLRNKYTNQQLFQWMTGQVSGLYFQSYQLAYDLAKRAERCMQHELGLAYDSANLIHFGYWDSLKKGLLAGDRLAYDLKRLQVAYLDGNVRKFELTKHISLIALAPERLVELKESGACEIEIPEWLFDLDTPGHYMRQMQMVSMTIPCVTGRYTDLRCKLQLLKSSYRQSADLTHGYSRLPADDPAGADKRFVDDRKILDAIVTSSGQNDAGLFEPSMRDERYLPFEGAGAISTWRLELPAQFQAFDYQTISDVIFHLRYTARDDASGDLKAEAIDSVSALLGAIGSAPLARFASLRHEFPSEWQQFVNSSGSSVNTITLNFAAARFPYFVQDRQIRIYAVDAMVRSELSTPPGIGIIAGQSTPMLAPGTSDQAGLARAHVVVQGGPGFWTLGTSADPKLVDDVFLIFRYSTG